MALSTPWVKMTQEEVERQYSPSRWVRRLAPDEVMQDHARNAQRESQLARTTLDCKLGEVYGPGDEQKIDIFGLDSLPADAAILVFVHGGYWQALTLAESSYLARCFVHAGAVVVSVGYDLCPRVTINDIIEQVKAATQKIIDFAKERGSRGIYLSGHSAGGHLVAMLLNHDWGQDADLIKGAAVISGVFDLRPLVTTSINEAIGMNRQTAWAVSPARLLPELLQRTLSTSRVLRFLVGDADSPEFIRQSQEVSMLLCASGVDSTCVVLPDTDHFSIVDDLAHADRPASQIIFELMGLSPEKSTS